MELLQLEYFLEAARCEHITESARRLHVSQPSITQAIGRLENELGVQLFERIGRGVRLTEGGRAFVERAEPALALLSEARDSARKAQEDGRATVRVNVLDASEAVIDAIAAYRLRFPDAKFHIGRDEASGRADIAVYTPRGGAGLARAKDDRAAVEFARAPSHAHERLEERIMLAMPASMHPGGKPVSLRDVEEESFILLSEAKTLRRVCDAACERNGFRPDAAFETDSPAVVRKMVRLGFGVGFWPEISWGAAEEGIALVPLIEPGFARAVEVAFLSREEERPDAWHFYRFLQSFLSERWQAAACAGADSPASTTARSSARLRLPAGATAY